MKAISAAVASRPVAGADAGVRVLRMPEAPPAAGEVLEVIGQHVLVDGFRLVLDLERSRGCRLVDAATGREYLDFYAFYGSLPVGFNHPWFDQPQVQSELLRAARIKVANSDVYSVPYAAFVRVFARVLGLAPLCRYFFIEGGALAVENALKAAMDWKVRRNLAAGREPGGTDVVHFQRAFHGRSGYTLSLTNTDPRKTDHFAKFSWPRLPAPALDFTLPEPLRSQAAARREREIEQLLRQLLEARGPQIAAVLIEPIQGEGGDNHFRGEWLATLRRLCDEFEVLLVFDEVQTGAGTTGRRWCCEHFGVLPDLLAFGKKAQACGVMAGPRLDEVPDNCFRLPSRLNSTWGGNLTDMVRATHYLRIIEQERLLENARDTGAALLEGLREIAADEPLLSAPRGRGLMVAFDLPDSALRERFYTGLSEVGLLALRGGQRSIRFRPALDLPAAAVPEALGLVREQCRRLRAGAAGPAHQAPTASSPPGKVLVLNAS
jgi:L-lysine 6-transaminase